MSRMTPDEWRKKKEEQKKQGSISSPATSSVPSTTTTSSGSSGRMTPSEWKEKKAGTSFEYWAKASVGLLNEMQNKYKNWSVKDEHSSYSSKLSNLLSQADNWRKQYAGNEEAVSYINSVVSALSDTKRNSFYVTDLYSKFDTEDEYNFWKTHSTLENRQQWYTDQQKRIEELKYERENSEYDWTDYNQRAAAAKRATEIDEEIASIEAEMRLYERGGYDEKGLYYGSKVVDDYHQDVTNRANFARDSAYRAYDNPTRDDLAKYDAMQDSSTWYTDANGVYRDAYGNELKVDASGNWVNPHAQGYEVTDRLGMFLKASEDELMDAAGTPVGMEGTWESIIKDGIDGNWEELTEGEIGIYYALRKNSQEAADKYLEDMKTELNHRATQAKEEKWAKGYDEAGFLEKIALNAATVPAKFVSNIAGTVENIANTLSDNDINPYSAAHGGMHFSQTVRGKTAADLDETGFKLPVINFTLGDIYQTGMSRLDSYLATSIFGGGGVAFLGMGAAQEEAKRLYEQGASNTQIAIDSLFAGAAEAVWEYMSFGKLKEIGDVDTFGKWVKSILVQGWNELEEEAATEVSNIITNAVVMGSQSDLAEMYKENKESAWKTFLGLVQQTAHAAFGGFIGGAGAGLVQASGSYAESQNRFAEYGGKIMKAGGEDALMDLANEVAGASGDKAKNAITKLQAKVTSKIAKDGKAESTMKAVGRLYNTVNTTVTEQNKADIAAELKNSGMSSKKANDIADALVALTKGRRLTSEQEQLLKDAKGNVDHALKKVTGDEKSSFSERNTKMAIFDNAIAVGTTVKELTEKAFTPDGKYKVSDTGEATVLETEVDVNGKTITKDTGEVIDIKGVASIRKGELLLDIGDGKTINAKNVAYANKNDALIYESIANLGDNINAETANRLIAKYDGGDAMVFARGMAQAYSYGFYGIDRSELTGKHTLTAELTEEQRNFAYGLGEQYRPTKDLADKAQARTTRSPSEKGVYYRGKDGNATDISTYLKESGIKLNDAQKTGIEAMRKLSAALGVRFNVFESWVENGKRYYLDENGVKTEGSPNGFYDTTTGEIYIDLQAGNDYQGTILFTVAHELTHFMRQWSPEHFTKIANIVFKHGGMKGNVSELIALKQKNAKDKGKPISYDTAMEEVVADGMETILKDGKVVEFMSEVKQKDRVAWEKIKGWFKNLAKFLRKMVVAYRGQSAQTVEGAKVADFAENLLRQIEQIWAEGAVAAGENYQTALENVVDANAEAVSTDEIITDGAVVTDGEGTKFSIKSMKHDIAEGQMFEDLKKYCGWTQSQVNELRNNLNDLVEYMTPHRDILDMNESYGREGRRFSPYKPNSDPLYKISMDFSTLCSKRLLTQYVIENLQLRENRPMSPEEQMAIRDMLNEYRKVEKGLQVACAMCYVEAARLKSPKQIQRWLDDPAPHLRNYFALKNTEFNAFVKKKQADFKESRGYARNTPKKDMKQADVTELNKIGPKLRSQYKLSAEEQAIIDKALTLPNSTYLTAGNLADLSETDPIIYAAYTSFVRTATRSKSLETDEPYYYGDSRRDNGNGIIVSDSFIEAVNRENGMRFSSWSDWRIQHMLDYITAVIDNSVRGAAMHGYTKFGEEVRVLGKTGMMFNMSGVAGTQTGLNEDGSLSFSPTESIDVNEAIQLREEFPEHAGLQCIGVSDAHIIALLRSDIIDYVIPYHVSGLNAALRRMADIYGWADYTGTQHAAIDKSIKKEDAVDPEHWHEEPVYSEFFVGYDTGMSGIEAMRASAEKYKQMCKDRGLTPKFNQFANEANYWKLLIDRKMINQQTGDLIRQKAVTPTFDFDAIKGVVDRYVDNYDSGLEARALNHIVENWDSIPQRIKDLKKKGGTKAKKAKKAVDTLANETLAAQPVDTSKLSMRTSIEETKDLLAYHNITQQLLLDVLNRKGLLMPSLAVTNKGMTDFGEISLLFDKSTIDPNANSNNKLYGADAWTPTQTKLKKNAKFDTDKTVRAVNSIKNRISSKFVSALFNVSPKQFKDTIINADGSIYDAYAHDVGMQTAYAMEQGIIAKVPTNKDGTLDKAELQKQLAKELDTDNGWRQYKKWLNNISDTVITSYDNASNEDILNNMKAQPATAKAFKLSENGELVVPAVEYSSIDEARKNKNRLSENAAEATRAVADEFLAFAKKVGGNTKSVVDAINASFANRYSTADIVKSFNANGIKISSKTAGELQSLYKKAVELPTQYFEAKPGREVGLDEIKAVVMPADASYAELKGKLEDAGISVVEYTAGSNESRVDALNSMDSLKFSDRDTAYHDALAENMENGNYTLYSDRFVEDKYFARQIDKLSDLKEGSYVTVGKIITGSPIERVGIPAGNLYFDVSKIRQEMVGRNDPIPPEIIKAIPKVLNHPMLITEFVDKAGKHSINVYGKLYIGSSPVVIGIMIGKHRNGQTVDKIQTVHPNRNFLDEVTDSNTLYLGENKKETNAWFQALGAQEPPLGGTKYGFIRMISQHNGTVKMSDRDSLTSDQQKHFDYNQKQKTVGSALKTLKGSSIKRSTKFGVGKEIGGEIYFHKDYAEDILPDEVLSQAMQLLEEEHHGFEYNCLKYNPKTGVVAFQEAPDFDSAREPVVGDYVSVNTDTGVVKTGHSNYIWHHKWNWVKNDYSGFDVAESWNWSKQWLSTLTEVSDGNGIERWNAQLDKFGLPHDGAKFSEREQEYDSKDTSVKILPATFTKFGLKATDRVLDWGGGQYDIAKKAVELGYPGIKFEVVDAFNRTKTHNDRILAEYTENPATILTINNVLNVIKETEIIEDVIRESKEYLAADGVCYIKIYEGNETDGKTGNGKVTSSGWQNNQPAEWYKPFAEKYYQYVERVGDILVASDNPIDKKALPKVDKETAGVMRGKVKEIAKAEPSMRASLYSDRDNAPTFYSQMARVVDGLKDGKYGAASLLNTMRNRGVKAEEIKWSGIEEWLEGKKSVSKAELQEFIAGSMLQIEEEILSNEERPYSEEHQKLLDEYTAERDKIGETLAAEWKRITGEEFPIRNLGAGVSSDVESKIRDINLEHKKAAFEGRLLAKLRGDLKEVIANNDDFGFDSWKEALISIHRNRKDFITHYEMSSEDKAVIVKYCNALNAYNEMPNKISDEDTDTLRDIAENIEKHNREIIQVRNKHYTDNAKYMAKWGSYKLKGGENYREILFKMPGSSYYNDAMSMHWGDRSGVLAHARIQDLNTFLGKMLFIEEIQSDWHNEGHKSGYNTKDRSVTTKLAELESQKEKLVAEEDALNKEHDQFLTRYWEENLPEADYDQEVRNYTKRIRELTDAKRAITTKINELKINAFGGVPDAPFKDNYHEYVLKRLIREAAEQDYDSIGWTTKEVQMQRWNPNRKTNAEMEIESKNPDAVAFEEGYRIEYDQDIRNFMDKFGKKWGARVGKTTLDSGTEVWSMAITDSMKESVLTDGQALYQDRDTESVSNRSLLANAFEGLAQNDIERNKIQEYKSKIDLINDEEKKLRELNEQIKELSFSKGPRDTKKIKALRFDAAQAANRINTYDKQLLRLEASKPLQDVLAREKRRAYKKAEERGKEALAEYKARVEAKQKETTEKWRESRKTAVAKARETAEKRDARAKLQKLVLDTVNWISYPAKTDVKCPDILKQPYADFLNGIDLSSKRLANGGDPTKNDLRLSNAMDSLATALDKIMTSQDPTQDVDKVLDTGYLDLPADFVMKLRDMTENIKSMMVEGDYVVNTMTAAEVRQLSQMIRTLNHAIKTMSNLYANLRFANVEALGFDTMEFMDALGEIEKTGNTKDFVQWDNALPYYAFKRFGKGGESVFEGLMDAQDKLAYLAQEIFNFRDKAWTGEEAKAWSEDTHTIKLPEGNELTLTTADAMSIYCLSRREQGLQHLLGGGTRVLGIQKGSQKAKDSRSLLTIKDIDAINSSLTDRQREVAEAIQEFMSTVCSEWGNEISMKRFLTKEFTEKFYFPIESNDENLPVKDPAAQQSDLFRLLNISATKPLTPGANNEVIIRNIFDVFTGHASDMARLNAYGLGLLDYMKWLNYREKTVTDEGQVKVRGVRKSMQQSYGNAAMSYVLNLVKDVNGRASDGGDPNFLMKMMRAAKTASVGSSLRVAALQLTSYPRAALVLSPKSLALGLSKMPNIKRAKKYCGIALWKSFGFYDTNISRSIEDQMKGVTDIKQKLIELSLKGAEWGDAITWGALWNACEYEVAQTTKNKVGSEEFYQEVGKKLRDVVYRTQVVDSTLTRSQIMRSKRGMAQEAAAFMSEPTLSANILMDAGFEFGMEKRRTGSAKKAWQKTGSYIGKAVAVYSIGQLTAALLESLFDAWRDDEDEKFGKKYLDAFVENLVLDIVPFNKLPIVSDAFEAALSMVGIGFYSSDKMSSTWLTQAVSAVDTWKKVLSGESSATVYNALYKTTRAVSSFYGVSISGVMREGVALWNNTAGAYDSTLKIRQYDLSNANLGGELYEAIISGNTRQADSLKAQFDDEASMHSAVRKALRENDPRIKEAAIAEFNGDPSERVRIARLIIADGFDQDDVVLAINAEINEMEPDEPAGDPKAKGLYTAENFAREIANGDQAAAYEAKADIIATEQKNGKSEDEAVKKFNNSAKTELKKLFMAGELTEQQVINTLVTFCDMEEEDAAKYAGSVAYEIEHPELDGVVTYTEYQRWETDGKPKGVTIEMFIEVAGFRDDGTSNSVKSQDEVALYIASVTTNRAERHALWCCFYKASTSPWR